MNYLYWHFIAQAHILLKELVFDLDCYLTEELLIDCKNLYYIVFLLYKDHSLLKLQFVGNISVLNYDPPVLSAKGAYLVHHFINKSCVSEDFNDQRGFLIQQPGHN